jgi:hypothetical protein
MEKASPWRAPRQTSRGRVVAGTASGNNDEAWPPRLPPWTRPVVWQSVTEVLDHHLSLPHFRIQDEVRQKAGAISLLMASLNRPMDALSRVTCPECEDPCCRRATLWYDFVDLLVMRSTRQPWPPGQPMAAVGAQCRYLGPTGCRMPRIRRPWICTWYLCPRQTIHLETVWPSRREAITRLIAGVKQLRGGLEDTFIDVAIGRLDRGR